MLRFAAATLFIAIVVLATEMSEASPPTSHSFAHSAPHVSNLTTLFFDATDLDKSIQQKTTQATAIIHVQLGTQRSIGSGFIVKAGGGTAYLVTNLHVLEIPEAPKAVRPTGKKSGKFKGPKSSPGFRKKKGSPFVRGPFGQQPAAQERPRVTVVLNSSAGQKEYPAQVVAVDEEADLAALRITGVRDLPDALDISQHPEVAETQPVYIFGYPVKGAGLPGLSVGKGTISGLRRDTQNELTEIHINGNIDPGNSGGPVIDSKGRLVGIAQARVPGKQIGFVIPTGELLDMFKGRLFLAAVFGAKQKLNQIELTGETWLHDRNNSVRDRDIITVKIPARGPRLNLPANEFLVYARLTDPMLKIKGANVYFARAENVATTPDAQGWTKLPGAASSILKIQDQDAIAQIKLPANVAPDQTFAFQFSYINADNKPIFTQPHLVRLSFPKNPLSVTLTITGIPDASTQRYIAETVPKSLPGKVTVKSKTKDSLVMVVDAVDDPKDLLPKITFGEVKSVQGRNIAITAGKITLPPPDDVMVAKALADLESTAKNPNIRRLAVDRLANVHAPLPSRRAEVMKALLKLVDQKDPFLRQNVPNALPIWASAEDAPALIEVLKKKTAIDGCIRALGKIQAPQAADVIVQYLPVQRNRAAASAALIALGPAAEKAVIPYVNHKDVFTAAEACKVLEQIGTRQSIPALTAAASRRQMPAVAAKKALKAVQSR